MTINIVHLYYDILNLYGESGNIKAMKNYLEQQNIKVNIKFITLNDKIDLTNIDLLYVGCGTESNQLMILKHLNKYKKEIKDFIDNKKYVIATGNSIELFGKTINNNKSLGIFNYNSIKTDFRIVDEALFKCNLIKSNIIGFQNQGSIIKDIDNYLFEVIKGTGSYPKSKNEGYIFNNFYGTYLIGPILVRNPELLTYLMNKLIKEKDKNYKINKINLNFEQKAYNIFTNMYYNSI